MSTNTGLQPVYEVEDNPKGREFHNKWTRTKDQLRPTNVQHKGRVRGRDSNGRGTAGRGMRLPHVAKMKRAGKEEPRILISTEEANRNAMSICEEGHDGDEERKINVGGNKPK